MFYTLFTRKTIYALLLLVATLIASGAWFIFQFSDIVGLILIVVYVGAVSMLFLYMVMLSDEKRASYFIEKGGYSLTSAFQSITVAIITLFGSFVYPTLFMHTDSAAWLEANSVEASISYIAGAYGYLIWPLILVGLILTVGMIIAIDIARASDKS